MAKEGKTFSFRPRGNSMMPLIKSGELVTVEPINDEVIDTLGEGDIVLCKVKGRIFLHLITARQGKGKKSRFQISNNHGHVNGWTRNVVGYVTAVEP